MSPTAASRATSFTKVQVVILESALFGDALIRLLEIASEHTLGASVHERVRDFVRDVVAHEFSDTQKPNPNHDVARVVWAAHLKALETTLGNFVVDNAARWERDDNVAAIAFVDAATDFCRNARRKFNNEVVDPDFPASEELTSAIDGLIANQSGLPTAAMRANALEAFAEAKVLENLSVGLKIGEIPSEFSDYFYKGGAAHHPRFIEIFREEIAGWVKKDEGARFLRILQTRWLADLKALGVESLEYLFRIEKLIENITKSLVDRNSIGVVHPTAVEMPFGFEISGRASTQHRQRNAKSDSLSVEYINSGYLEDVLAPMPDRAVPSRPAKRVRVGQDAQRERYAYFEKFGLDRVKNELLGARHFLICVNEQDRILAGEWVRMKEAER